MNSIVGAIAHVKWFAESDEGLVFDPKTLVIALVIVVVGYLVATQVAKYTDPILDKYTKKLAKYYKYLLPIIRISLGLSLLLATWKGYVIAPDVDEAGTLFLALQAAIGLSWVSGLGLKWSAVGSSLLYVPVYMHSPWSVLEHLDVLATAMLLYSSVNNKLAAKNDVNTYRMLIAVSLITLAFTEKLLAPSLAGNFLMSHHWNFLSSVGVTNGLFTAIIGSLELLFGILIFTGVASRLVVLAILCTMVVTAYALGIGEVYGHLFAVGLVAAIWLPASKKVK